MISSTRSAPRSTGVAVGSRFKMVPLVCPGRGGPPAVMGGRARTGPCPPYNCPSSPQVYPTDMFDNLTARLSRNIEGLRGKGRITEENIGETLREARMALLEADVALPVVKSFTEAVKAKALGSE